MENYFKWRGDITMSERKFNEIDNLILSELAYFDFGQVMPRNGRGITISKAYEKYNTLDNPTEYFINSPIKMLEWCAGSMRFANIRIFDYVDIIDEKRQMQYASMTFALEDGTLYIAFRGTDDSIVGWREDMNLFYMEETGSQGQAVKYLERIMLKSDAKVRVGGHSKGGNLAVYAAAFCKPCFRKRIVEVFSNDGPGFNCLVTVRAGYRQVLKKVKHFIPSDSVVGIFMSEDFDSVVIDSTKKMGVEQHDPYSWICDVDHFKKAEAQTQRSEMLDETLTMWLNKTSFQERKKLVDDAFDAFAELDAQTLHELDANKWKTINELIKIAIAQDPEIRKNNISAFLKLAKSGEKVRKGWR